MGVGCLNNTCSKRTLRDGGYLDAVDGPRDWTTSRYHEETGRDRSDVQLDTRYAVRQGLSTDGRLADSRATHVQAIPPTRGDPVPQLSHMHMHTPCTPCTLLQVGTPPPTKAWSPAAGWCSKPKAHPQPRATTRLSPPLPSVRVGALWQCCTCDWCALANCSMGMRLHTLCMRAGRSQHGCPPRMQIARLGDVGRWLPVWATRGREDGEQSQPLASCIQGCNGEQLPDTDERKQSAQPS